MRYTTTDLIKHGQTFNFIPLQLHLPGPQASELGEGSGPLTFMFEVAQYDRGPQFRKLFSHLSVKSIAVFSELILF